jgi:hypothetical protein
MFEFDICEPYFRNNPSRKRAGNTGIMETATTMITDNIAVPDNKAHTEADEDAAVMETDAVTMETEDVAMEMETLGETEAPIVAPSMEDTMNDNVVAATGQSGKCSLNYVMYSFATDNFGSGNVNR